MCEGWIPSTSILDLISNHLPNISYIVCEDKNITGNYGISFARWDMNLSKFKNLHVFYFDIRLISKECSTDLCFIKFIYTDGTRVDYFCIMEEGLYLRPVSPAFLEKNKTSVYKSLTFHCEKIERFVIYNGEEESAIEFNKGQLKESRLLGSTDSWYAQLSMS